MSKNIDSDNEVWFRDVTGLNIADEYIPIFIGIITVTILSLLLVIIYILWHCLMSTDQIKEQEVTTISTIEKNVANNSNYSTFGADGNREQFSSSVRVVELIPEYDNSVHWLYRNHMLPQVPSSENETKVMKKTTPRSSPDRIDARSFLSKPSKPYSRSVVLSPVLSLDDYSLPQISQFSTQPCPYICSIFLDDHYIPSNGVNHFRTRSLPSCVRFKRHASAHPDNSVELYDKVNFSKKRKNRMRNDEAAIIALSRSRSQFLNKDTDSLVDNEAVIVYDERTAL